MVKGGRTWFVSDTHFGHARILTFKKNDGSLLRDFKNVEEMDETMVSNWNSVVNPEDRVYHLGDVVMNRRSLGILRRLKGRKVLIKGNHDIFKLNDYTEFFDDIRAYKVYPKHGIICSHMPVHPQQLENRFGFNVHGHLHGNFIPDKRYLNISVERTNFTPTSFDDILKSLGITKGKSNKESNKHVV